MLRRPTPPPGPLDRVLRLPDSRLLGYAEFGDPAGDGVLVFHANPGSRLTAQPLDAAAKEHRLRLIALERPGFGLSDDHADRTLETWSADVDEAARHLGLEQYAILALREGVPYALAAAQAHPDRTTVLALAGEARQPGRERLTWLRFELLRLAATRFPSLAIRHLRSRASAESRATLEHRAVRTAALADLREAFRHGPSGAAHDAALLARTEIPPEPGAGIQVIRWPPADGLPWLAAHASELLGELQAATR